MDQYFNASCLEQLNSVFFDFDPNFEILAFLNCWS